MPVEPELPQSLAYSVKSYRHTEKQRTKSPPCARVYSLDLAARSPEAAEASARQLMIGLSARASESKRMQSLQQLARQQEAVIMQASKALHEVIANGLSGSAQHVECSRVLVVACQKRQAFLEQCSRLQHGLASGNAGSGTSSVLTVSGVRLALKSSYLQRLKLQQQLLQHGGDTAIEQHHFLCMLRLQDGRIHATELTSTGSNFGPTGRDFVEIPTCLTVKDLPQVGLQRRVFVCPLCSLKVSVAVSAGFRGQPRRVRLLVDSGKRAHSPGNTRRQQPASAHAVT